MQALEKLFNFRLRAGRVAGVDVFLHWTLLAFGLYVLFQHVDRPQIGVLVVAGVFGSVFLHELGHCWGARRVGGDADEVLLWPLGGLASLRVARRPWPQFFSTLTGPLTNLLIATACLPAYLLVGGELAWLLPGSGFGGAGTAALVLYFLIEINLFLLVFNLVPAFPMDGGRLLHTALWPWLGHDPALKVAIYAAFASAGGMVVYALVTGASMVGVIGVWVIFSAWRELLALRFGLHDVPPDEPWTASLYEVEEDEPRPSRFARWRAERRRRREEAERQRRAALRNRMDEVLAKVSAEGLDALTRDERRFLERASAELRKEQQGSP